MSFVNKIGKWSSAIPYRSHDPLPDREDKKMISVVKSFANDESGATAIEYGLIAALVSVAAIGALNAMGGSLTNIFGVVDTELGTAATAAAGAGGGGAGGGGTP